MIPLEIFAHSSILRPGIVLVIVPPFFQTLVDNDLKSTLQVVPKRGGMLHLPPLGKVQ